MVDLEKSVLDEVEKILTERAGADHWLTKAFLSLRATNRSVWVWVLAAIVALVAFRLYGRFVLHRGDAKPGASPLGRPVTVTDQQYHYPEMGSTSFVCGPDRRPYIVYTSSAN